MSCAHPALLAKMQVDFVDSWLKGQRPRTGWSLQSLSTEDSSDSEGEDEMLTCVGPSKNKMPFDANRQQLPMHMGVSSDGIRNSNDWAQSEESQCVSDAESNLTKSNFNSENSVDGKKAGKSIIFEPGFLGLIVDERGLVEKVKEGEQSASKGVKAGWKIKTIDHQLFAQDVLKQRTMGRASYLLLFDTNDDGEMSDNTAEDYGMDADNDEDGDVDGATLAVTRESEVSEDNVVAWARPRKMQLALESSLPNVSYPATLVVRNTFLNFDCDLSSVHVRQIHSEPGTPRRVDDLESSKHYAPSWRSG